jgi:esterase/lipase superfamily enzyme
MTMTTVSEAIMAQRITVYFATNRQPVLDGAGNTIVDFTADPGPIGGYAVRFGQAQVDVDLAALKNDLVAGSLCVAPEVLTPAPGAAPVFGSKTIFDAIRQEMASKKLPTLVFIHGFSNSFQDSIERAGWNSAFLAAGGFVANIFVFSWPSKGGLGGDVPLPYIDYEHDRGTAAGSGPAIARTLKILYDFVDSLPKQDWCFQQLNLLCHSMGNYALRNGLQSWLRLPDQATAASPPSSLTYVDHAEREAIVARRTFDQIVLAAADEDDDAFDDAAKLEPLSRLGNGITVYHTKKDWVLNTLSSKTKFNGARLGTNGPDNMAQISDKVTAVDVSDVFTLADDFEGHQYYRKVPAIRDDIAKVFLGNRPNQIPNRTFLMTGRWALTPAKQKKAKAAAAGVRT